MDALDAFEAILGPDQNISAEGLDDDEIMSEDDDDEEEEDEYEDEEDEDEEEDEDMEENSDIDENEDSIEVTMPLLKEWTTAVNKKSPAAWKKMLLAFRSIVRSDEPAKTKFTYRVESSKGIFIKKKSSVQILNPSFYIYI